MEYLLDELESQGGGIADKKTIDGRCDFLRLNEGKLFIDKFNQDYIVYKRVQQKGKKTLEKAFELLCDAVQVKTIVVYGNQYQVVDDYANKLLTMVEGIFSQQKQSKLHTQKIARAAQENQNSIVR